MGEQTSAEFDDQALIDAATATIVVEPNPAAKRNSWVTIERVAADGTEQRFKIVSSDDADAVLGWVSEESPLGRAVTGAHAGDVVDVQGVRNPFQVKVLAVVNV
ncbi:GreA/GreB family elongation factor [Nocardia sp. NPDC052001]|uniref:GreA/GreB family elongation factor n=1 Tax=unclassified Nocardia TaxID=2637762 RepID=UPI0033B13692